MTKMENSQRKNFRKNFPAAVFHSLLVFLGEFVIRFEERLAVKVYMYIALIISLLIGSFSLVYTLWTKDSNVKAALHQVTAESSAVSNQTTQKTLQNKLVNSKTALDIQSYYFFEEEINLEETSNLLIRPKPSLAPLYDASQLKEHFTKKEIFNTEDINIEQEITKLAK